MASGPTPINYALQHITIPLYWNGWRADTELLWRDGWQLFAEEGLDLYNHSYRVSLALRCPDDRLLLSGTVFVPRDYAYDHLDNMRGMGRYKEYSSVHCLEYLSRTGVRLNAYTCKDTHYVSTQLNQMERLRPVESIYNTSESIEAKRIGDLPVFTYKPIKEDAPEFYIPKGSVDECLNRILQLQYPIQKELREDKKLLLETKQPLIQAKLFSIAA